jgi:MATE family multidrug resistance protein
MSPEEPRSLVQKDRSSDDHIESRREGKADPVWWEESQQFINLAVPSIIVEVGLTIPLALTASYVGRHLGPVYLGGFTLATLTGNLLTLSLLWGLYSASDTLSPQAFGAGNYKEVGMVAMRGVIGSFIILVPINSALFFFMEDLLLFCGEDPEASRLAAQWYRVYMFALPFYALYMVTWKFLSAQEIMRPLIIALFVAVGVVLPVSLQVLVPSLGFMGSAIAVLIYQISHPLLLLGYLAWKQPHHPETWPGIECWKDALTWEPLKIFLQLGFGGMLACGEWMWWEVSLWCALFLPESRLELTV